jgi:triacylglycerol esterase/lipase EstA (alpha/beta hydrolase family)
VQGLGNNTADYNELVASLEARGLKAIVAQVSRLDWLRNAAGLLDANYWKGSLQPRPVLDWYLERTKNAIATAKAMGQDSQKVSVIGHSAGGWLARVFMTNYGTDDIDLLLTLGTPHLYVPNFHRVHHILHILISFLA